MRKTVLLSIAVIVVLTSVAGPVAADPPHQGLDAKAGNGSDNAGHGNNCDGGDSDNPGASSGVSDGAMEHRQSTDIHCPEDES